MRTFSLWLVEIITWKSCIFAESQQNFNTTLSIAVIGSEKTGKDECLSERENCEAYFDGYYIEVLLNIVYGIIWYQFGKRMIQRLQNYQQHEWNVLTRLSGAEMEKISIV
jgi:hypothetical protein